jgi:hypothetical protein
MRNEKKQDKQSHEGSGVRDAGSLGRLCSSTPSSLTAHSHERGQNVR